jgi:phage tail-like protein
MPKIDPNFQYDIYKFIHKPIRDIDKREGNDFLQRFLIGKQIEFEKMQARIKTLSTLNDPARIRADLLIYLKDIVGFTNDLNNITQDLSENDLRKLISLAVALWKQKGTEPGYANIVRLFVGKTARIFNWFDFRFIIGEKAFGEEQLGEDSWLISVPGVEGSEDTSNNVVALYTFENNFLDRSILVNEAVGVSPYQFYTNPNSGFPNGSTKHLALQGGVVRINNSDDYDLSQDFTVELFIRSSISEANKTLVHKMDGSGKGFKIEIDKAAKTVSYTVSDGITTITDSLITSFDLDNNIVRHIALMVDRANDGIRLYVNGTESTAKSSLGIMGDVTNFAKMFIGGEGVGINTVKVDVDNFRLALNSVYNVDSATLTPPLSGFIEYQIEQLDEFKTDIRIVDDGTGNLNKVLIQRILNLMRPVSERINVIFIRFFDDFVDGIGQFNVAQGSANVNSEFQMELAPSTIVNTSVFGDTEFQDIVLQVKAENASSTGGVFSVLFFFQDINNYYEFRIDTVNRETSLYKVVGGVTTQISAPVTEDIVPQASYIFTVITDLSAANGDTVIKAYVDSNKQHEIIDASFTKGKFGMKTNASTIMKIDEIEMMVIPTDVRTIAPGFDL